MRKALSRLPRSGVRRKEESLVFRRMSVETPTTDEIARIRLDGGLEIALTAAVEPGWVAALLNALEMRR
jgi:hypothetical protein